MCGGIHPVGYHGFTSITWSQPFCRYTPWYTNKHWEGFSNTYDLGIYFISIAPFIGVSWSCMVIFGYVYEWCVRAGDEHVYTNMFLLFYSAWSLHFRAYSIPQVLDKSHLSPPIPIELGAMYSIFPSRGWTSLGISGTRLKHGTWCVRSEFPKSGRWIKQNKISLG
jgi:hypothetical protein